MNILARADTVTAELVHLRGYGMSFVAKALGCCAKVSSFCTITPGPIMPIGLVTG